MGSKTSVRTTPMVKGVNDRLYVDAWCHAQAVLPRLCSNQVHDPADAFAFIVRFKRDHDGASPTSRDLMAALQIPSSSVAYNVLRQLERAGLIQMEPGLSRSIRIPGGRWDWLRESKP